MCERELENEQNCNILTPTLMAVSVVSFSFSRPAQPEAQGLSFLLRAGFLYHILSATSLDPNSSGDPRAPSAGWGFPYHPSSITPISNCNSNCLTSVLTELYNSSTSTQSPTNLWNGMFDRHQAEITVMLFTGHSLPVHHSVVVQWDLHLVPYYQP